MNTASHKNLPRTKGWFSFRWGDSVPNPPELVFAFTQLENTRYVFPAEGCREFFIYLTGPVSHLEAHDAAGKRFAGDYRIEHVSPVGVALRSFLAEPTSVLPLLGRAIEKWRRHSLRDARLEIKNWVFAKKAPAVPSYLFWLQRQMKSPGGIADTSVGKIFFTIEGDAQNARTLASLEAQTDPHWRFATEERVKGSFGAVIQGGDELEPTAVQNIRNYFALSPQTQILYTDEDERDATGKRHSPRLKPDWNRFLFLASDYIGSLVIFRQELIEGVLYPYETILRALPGLQGTQIAHLPKVLYHRHAPRKVDWARHQLILQDYFSREGIRASVKAFPPAGLRIHYALPRPRPKVSVIICTRDRLDLLARVVSDVLEQTEYEPIELIVVDNGSTERKTLEYLRDLEKTHASTILRYPHPFNFSALNNLGAREAQGEYLLFLNNDIRVIHPEWLTEMMSLAVQEGVGAVGAKLYHLNNTIQHAGVITGVGEKNIAAHAHRLQSRWDSGYLHRASLIQEFSAVTAACLLVKREHFLTVGGFDERNLAVTYNDLDLCLKLKQMGLSIVFTPYAELYHLESVSRGKEMTRAQRESYLKEAAFVQEKWRRVLERDPAYHPGLTRSEEDFSLALPEERGAHA